MMVYISLIRVSLIRISLTAGVVITKVGLEQSKNGIKIMD